MTTDQFRNRPMTVRILTLCTRCNRLRDDVEKRTIFMYLASRTIESCNPCYREEINSLSSLGR
ncbi:hypothetical protein [Burkholderia sp. BE12]|uniref:hypothetical protein n=1 Tax=Burkholderia sp. BE12 TaxID=2082394 RepID=UPI00131A3DAB|nr:hypothetical protein [Burkholderia sp. BE12]